MSTSRNKPKQKKSPSVTGSRPHRVRQDTRGLGKGLQALLGDSDVVRSITSQASDNAASGDSMLAIDRIAPSAWQPRQDFDKGELMELAASIKSHGIIQPLLVRPHADKADYFELIAGERRWRAAQLAQIHTVPVVIRNASHAQAAEIALIENIQRRDLNAIEEGMGYRQLLDEFGHTQEVLAEIVGKSRAHVANSMRLLQLPTSVKDMVIRGELTAGQVRPLIGKKDAAVLAREIALKKMTAREVEALVAQPTSKAKASQPQDPDIKALEASLAEALGLVVKVDFNRTTGKGSISIRVDSMEQCDSVIDRLLQ